MKKLLILGLFMTAVTMISCGNKTSNQGTADTVTVDSVDTTVVDSVH